MMMPFWGSYRALRRRLLVVSCVSLWFTEPAGLYPLVDGFIQTLLEDVPSQTPLRKIILPLQSERLAQAIEVLLRAHAFVVKRLDESILKNTEGSEDLDPKLRLGQITWNKHGGVENAWSVAMARAGFPTVP